MNHMDVWQVLTAAWWALAVARWPGEDGVLRALRRFSIPPPTKDVARDQHCLLCPAMSRCFGQLPPTPPVARSSLQSPVTPGAPPAIGTSSSILPDGRPEIPPTSSSNPTAKSYLVITVSFESLPYCVVGA